jgi:hypothetical protein
MKETRDGEQLLPKGTRIDMYHVHIWWFLAEIMEKERKTKDK